MHISFRPPYISVNIGNKHIFFGWYYNLETYLDETGEKPVLKTRKAGLRHFKGITDLVVQKSDGVSPYEAMIIKWNSEGAAKNV